ncbi:hypothetical protein ACQY0O_005991 [Thecaphora frezii]
MEKATPLINSSMLSQYRGQTVRVIGKITKLVGHTLLLQTSDMGNVEVTLNPDTHLSGTGYVEVIGKVSEGMDGESTIREFTTVAFGESLDLDLVEKVIQVSQHVPELFRET